MSHLSMSLEWSFPLRTFLLDVEIPNVASCNSKLVVGPGTLDSCFNQASHGFIKKRSIAMCFSNLHLSRYLFFFFTVSNTLLYFKHPQLDPKFSSNQLKDTKQDNVFVFVS